MKTLNCSLISKQLFDYFYKLSCVDLYIHSVFTHALNLLADTELITVVVANRDLYPYGMVLDSQADFETLNLAQWQKCTLSFKEKIICFGSVNINFSEAKMYDCSFLISLNQKEPENSRATWAEIQQKHLPLKSYVLAKGSDQGLLPLLCEDGALKQNIWCDFLGPRIALIAQDFKQNLNNTFRHSLAEHFSLITGAGPGLTPSGDDFITGILSAVFSLSFYGFISKETALTVGQCALINTDKTNLISAAFIRQASEGLFSRYMIEFIKCLFCKKGVDKELLGLLDRILEFGSSSGTDIMTGFLFSLNVCNNVVS